MRLAHLVLLALGGGCNYDVDAVRTIVDPYVIATDAGYFVSWARTSSPPPGRSDDSPGRVIPDPNAGPKLVRLDAAGVPDPVQSTRDGYVPLLAWTGSALVEVSGERALDEQNSVTTEWTVSTRDASGGEIRTGLFRDPRDADGNFHDVGLTARSTSLVFASRAPIFARVDEAGVFQPKVLYAPRGINETIATAFDGEDGYLIVSVIEEEDRVHSRISSRRIDGAGALVDIVPILLGTGVVPTRAPTWPEAWRAVAVTGDGARHLAVWSPDGGQLLGRRIAEDGTPMEATPLVVSSGVGPGTTAAFASFDGASYVVAWEDGGRWLTRVSTDGALIDDAPLAIDVDPRRQLTGFACAARACLAVLSEPKVAGSRAASALWTVRIDTAARAVEPPARLASIED
jgi:hypothetical protein